MTKDKLFLKGDYVYRKTDGSSGVVDLDSNISQIIWWKDSRVHCTRAFLMGFSLLKTKES